MAMKQLYINGTGTGDFGIYISSDTYLSAPSIEYIEYQVPGRNGNLVNSSGRLNNIIRKFDCYIPNNAQANFDGFKKLLYSSIGYLQISSDYESDTYQLGYLAQEIEATPFLSDDVLKVSFELYFSCQPQKFRNTVSHLTATSGTVAQDRYIIPKTDGWITRMMKTIPSYDLPSADYYLVSIGQSFQTTVSNITVNFPESDFIGLAVMEFSPSTQEIIDYLGYANSGNLLKYSGTYTKPSGYYNPCLVYITPLEALGTLSSEGEADGSAFHDVRTMHHLLDGTNIHAVGFNAEYKFTFSTEQRGRWALHNYTVIKGHLNGEEQWKGVVDINADALSQFVGISSTPDFEIIIDSENLTVRGGKIGDNLNLNAYVNIIGQIDGLADEIEIINYRTVEGQVQIRQVDVYARWWKV